MSPKITVNANNSLAALHPAIAAQWHLTRNGDLTPEQVTAGTDRRAWWRCLVNPAHEWVATIGQRVRRSHGCPFCAGRRVDASNSLSRRHPALAQQWHPTLNGDLTPDDVTDGTSRRVWWQCSRGPEHVWQAAINERSRRGNGCPFCSGHRILPEQSLAGKYPSLARQWHPTLNGDLTPDRVAAGSNEKAWWQCAEQLDHVWSAVIANRALHGRGCPFCHGQRVTPTTSLAYLHPHLVAQWHPSLNGTLRPEDLRPGSNRRIWWRCSAGPDHVWPATPSSRALRGTGCPFCASQRVSVTNALATQRPDLAAQWHPTRNGKLTPDQIVVGSNRRVWWKCPAGPDHEWVEIVDNRTRLNAGCPFCAHKRVSVTNSLAGLFPDVAAEWHPTKNGDRTPEDTLGGWKHKVWWLCGSDPSHEWKSTVHSRTFYQTICPYCHLDDREIRQRLQRNVESGIIPAKKRSQAQRAVDRMIDRPTGRRRRSRESPTTMMTSSTAGTKRL